MKRVDAVKLNDDIRIYSIFIDPSNWYGFFNQLELEHHSTCWYIVHHIISLYKLELMYSNFIDIPFQDKKKNSTPSRVERINDIILHDAQISKNFDRSYPPPPLDHPRAK